MTYLGDFNPGDVFTCKFATVTSSGAGTTFTGSPVVSCFKDSSTASITTGVTLTTNFASLTGSNHLSIDTSTSASFYAAGSDFQLVATAGTVGGTSIAGYVLGQFSLQHRSPLRPTTAGRALDVTATGAAGIDWANVENQSTAVTLSATSTLALQPTVAGNKLDVTATGAAGIDWGNVENQTTTVGLTNTTINTSGIMTTAMTESYAALHAAPTPAQILFEMRSVLVENSVSSTTVTTKKIDGSTTAETFTINDAATPTSITRAS